MVLRDWVAEGDAGMHVGSMIREATLDAGRAPRVIVPASAFDSSRSFGLIAGMRGVAKAVAGGEPEVGRQVIRKLLVSTHLGVPMLLVDAQASWTLRALSGGYHRVPGQAQPAESIYATLMEALEAACARLGEGQENPQRMATLPSGERYATAEVVRRPRPA